MSVVHDRVVGEIDDQIRVFHTFQFYNRIGFGRLIASENGFYPCNQFFGIKGLHDVIICTQLQSQHLVEDFAFGGEHDDWHVIFCTDFPADLISINARKHQIQENQVWIVLIKGNQSLLAVIHNAGVVTLLREVQGYQFCNIVIIVYD